VKSDRLLIGWAYLAELFCATLITAFISLFVPELKLAEFLSKTAGAWAALTGGLFAVAMAIWIVLFQVSATPFGDWLDRRGALRIYSLGFATAAGVYAGATALLIVTSFAATSVSLINYLALFGLLLAVLNTYTVVRNGTDLLRLQSAFRTRIRGMHKK
jgi:hypothetical protein